MIKIIIIDDEAIIRESLTRFIDWASIGVEVCGTAANGVTAMAMILTQKPDIILTDIRMPSLDGLDLIRMIREQQLPAEVIFISAHSSFDYARQAISLGAFGYITKPINEEELLDMVERCAKKIRSNEQTSQILSSYQQTCQQKRQLILSRLALQKAALTAEEESLLQDCPGFYSDFSWYTAIGIWYSCDHTDFLSEELLSELCPDTSDTAHLLFSPEPHMQLIILLSAQSSSSPLYQTARKLTLADLFAAEDTLTILSDVHPWEHNFYHAYVENALTYAAHTVKKEYGIFNFRDTFCKTASPTSMEEFKKHYYSGGLTKSTLPAMLSEFISFFIKDGTLYDLEYVKLHFIHLIDSGVEALGGSKLHSYLHQDILSAQKSITAQNHIGEVYIAAYNLFFNLLSSLEEMDRKSTSQLVRSSISYIRDHYAENITLAEISGHLYVSPTYFSKIFSQEMGQPFSRYLLEYRISKSIELLRDPNNKIASIAISCGFSDVTYFSKAFKSVTGMSPHRYRNHKL